MTYVPIFWLLASILMVPYRPGFMLGCAMLAFQYDNLYNTSVMGPSLFVIFLISMLFIAFIQKRLFVLVSYDYLIMLFGFLYVLAMFYSPDISTGIKISGRLVLLCIGYFFIGRLLSSSHIYSERYLYDFGTSILLLTLVFGYQSVGLQETSVRLVLGKGSPVGFSQMLDIACGFSLFYLLSASGINMWFKRIAMLPVFTGVMLLLLLNATRGTIVSLVFALCVYLAVSIFRWRPDSHFFSRSLSFGFMLVGVAVFLFQFGDQPGSASIGFSRLGMNFGAGGLQGDTSTANRLEFFSLAWEMFANAPLFGQGIGSFLWDGKPHYPHNVFMELLAETGLIATSVFTIILVKTGWMAARLFRYPLPEATIVAGLFFIMVVHQQISFALWMAKPMFFSMGVIVSLHLRLEKSQLASPLPQRPENSRGILLSDMHVK